MMECEVEQSGLSEPVARPMVASTRKAGTFGYVVVVMVGVGVLGGLTLSRTRHADTGLLIAPANAATTARFATAEPLPSDAAPSTNGVPSAIVAPQYATNNMAPMQETPTSIAAPVPDRSVTSPSGATIVSSRLAAPALVVDLGETPTAVVGKASATLAPTNPALAAAGKSGDETDQFVARASARNDAAQAARMGRLDMIVAEGTLIGAALETAINSDLPGFARAVISRDVMSFDGTRLLIPRGSRVIGQYKSGVALGASRVFVIWTRLIRPDGVSIQLASSGGDDLGRSGIGGKVDRHFLQRFGGSLLMSVVNGAIDAGVAAVSRGGVPVYINSVAQAGQAVTSAFKSADIPPTITARQGSSVKIFVARDLDFSNADDAP